MAESATTHGPTAESAAVEGEARALSVVLVGPPGAGKSTIGRKLARELGVDLYDTDAGIEEQTGRTIPEIFAADGEPEFRRIEEEVVAAAVRDHRGVISLGGGSILSAATRAVLRGHTVIYLEISVGEGLRRTGASTNRPLLVGDDPAKKYRELMKIRRPLYREVATIRVRTDGRSPGRVVRMILAKLGIEPTERPEDSTPPPTQTSTPSGKSRSRRRRRGRGRGDAQTTSGTKSTAPVADSSGDTAAGTQAARATATATRQPGGATNQRGESALEAAEAPKRKRRSRRSRRRRGGESTAATATAGFAGSSSRTGEPSGGHDDTATTGRPHGVSATGNADAAAHGDPGNTGTSAHRGSGKAGTSAHRDPSNADTSAHRGSGKAGTSAHRDPSNADTSAHRGSRSAGVAAHRDPDNAGIAPHRDPGNARPAGGAANDLSGKADDVAASPDTRGSSPRAATRRGKRMRRATRPSGPADPNAAAARTNSRTAPENPTTPGDFGSVDHRTGEATRPTNSGRDAGSARPGTANSPAAQGGSNTADTTDTPSPGRSRRARARRARARRSRGAQGEQGDAQRSPVPPAREESELH